MKKTILILKVAILMRICDSVRSMKIAHCNLQLPSKLDRTIAMSLFLNSDSSWNVFNIHSTKIVQWKTSKVWCVCVLCWSIPIKHVKTINIGL